jgi:PII-like signaling protein
MKSTKYSTLKIYASTTDKLEHKPLYEYIVRKAKDEGINGATVFRGIMGFGLSSEIHSSKFWELTEKLPVLIEIIDKSDKLDKFYKLIEPELNKMSKGCLVIFEPVNVKLLKAGGD